MRVKRIHLKRNATRQQIRTAWLARQREYQRRIRKLQTLLVAQDDEITTLQDRNDRLQDEREQRHRDQVKNWALYDQAYAEMSQQELDLFKASPAYLKYQQWRQKRNNNESA